MLRLRKILLSNKLYICILIIISLITIIRLNIPRESIYKSNQTKFIFIIEKYSIDQDKLNIYLKNKETVIGTYYFKNIKEVNNFKEKYNLGDKLLIEGNLSRPSPNTTNNLFNYKEYLYNKNIFYNLEISKYKKINNNKNIYYFIKQKVINNLNNNRYLYTFILGDKSYLSSKVIKSYQENGISHLFAISGMHITLLSGLLLKLLSKLKIKENKRYFITIIFLLFYLLLADKSPSILRGVLFFILFSINKIYYFYIKPINIFIIALSITLLINPYYLFDIGFQYSFLISLSLLLTTNYLKSNNYIIGLLKVSIISTIISIPIQLRNFYQLNILSIIYNLVFVPFISIILFPLSLLVFIFKPLEIIYNFLINILENISLFLSNINIFKLYFYKLPDIFYIIYLILIIIFLYLYIYKNKKKCIFILLVILILHNNINLINRSNYIYMIDIGQGDSILLHINNKNVLIDTGGKDEYITNGFNSRIKRKNITDNTTIPLLKSLGIKKIDTIIISHGDFDHMGDSINIINNIKVNKVIFNCGDYNYLEKELISVLEKKNINYYSCIKELNIDKYKLIFLNTKIYNNENDNSNVVYLNYKNIKFLFMGDAGVDKEKDILEKYNLKYIDFLKIGHHGSNSSTSKSFINNINPKYSLISVGKNNRYGHPTKEVLKTLRNTNILRTDINGSIKIKLKNKEY